MDDAVIRQVVMSRMRSHGLGVEEAARVIAEGFSMQYSEISHVVESIRREGARNMLLDSPPGVYAKQVYDEAKLSGWYAGPQIGDEVWPRLRDKLESGPMRDVVPEIDQASTKVVAHLADPAVLHLKKKGMVVGYVQSGKTANYTAVMAKAVDAGYRVCIVLSGLHNNLRKQTQVRIANDIINHDWVPLTTEDGDFSADAAPGAPLLRKRVATIAVVKKNQTRLSALRDWLHDIPEEIRSRTAILLLDDEADQATPNSATGLQQYTAINKLVRQIWSEIPTGTYIGYTATPFANVFMDPNDDEELYPADFIIDLPRPNNYFGAERLFGREPLDDADEPEPGIDLIRSIPDDDAKSLRPSTKKDERQKFNPDIPSSLIDAVSWFIVATAIRRARGQDRHNSMLVHTTHYTDPHFAMKERLEALLSEFMDELNAGKSARFKQSYEREAFRAEEVASRTMPEWPAVELEIDGVLEDLRVVVDNGESEDRLNYTDERIETVIAVGGGTLSRGLTLEGLVVSYFTRTSNTYDTLLQMGRWFGYRVGYEDLPRIWVQDSLADDFRFLALVEEEIRRDMRDMERQLKTPRELGVRIREHPGRLAIVARNKMRHAQLVRVSFSGQRLQTFIFDENDVDGLQLNHRVVREHIAACKKVTRWAQMKDARGNLLPRWLATGVPSEEIISLLKKYRFHEDQVGLRPDHMIGWIESVASDAEWNTVVIGSNKSYKDKDGSPLDLGSLDLGLGSPIKAVNRAPLVKPVGGVANIKALLSHHDWFADLDRSELAQLTDGDTDNPQDIRRRLCGNRGLIVVYVVSKDSIPMGAAAQMNPPSRRNMSAPTHMVGLGIIFPSTDDPSHAASGNYLAVRPDWDVEAVDEDDEVPADREGDAVNVVAE
ncbi:Z1 domain-containing protein [Gordonia alkanivorans]|uniref:Z1 domain-containing protein n=1 Tax=Gordonia alkanivorans TaxID=84096 RepID=UPI0004B9CB93|nr:Z1 domain-containing protein [Gordonia alkanivorans]